MSFLKSVGKYFNMHVLGYRYDNEIINYFNESYKKAILNLYKDGYPVQDEYMRLKDEYKSRYSPLNSEEIEFFSSYQESKANSSLDITKVSEIELQIRIVQLTSFILIMDTKNTELESRLENELKMASLHSEILSKEIKRINPVYNAVITRKFVKLLEEKLIFKFINYFNVKNFIPNIETLKKYRNKLDTMQFDNKYQLLNSIDGEILSLNALDSKKINSGKNKPKIEYLNYNKITKIHKILKAIKSRCNNIIHFDPNNEVEFNLDEFIFQYVIPKDEQQSNFVDNQIVINEQEQNTNKTYFVNLAKVIDYITNENIHNQLLEELTKLKEEYDSSISSIYSDLEKADLKKEINSFKIDEESREIIFFYSNKVETEMDKAGVPNFIKSFQKKEVSKIIEKINSNKLNHKEIEIENPTEKEKKYLSIINRELDKLDIYSRIKFNLNFERDMELVELKTKIDKIKNSIVIIDTFVNSLTALDSQISQQMNIFKRKISLINNCLFSFDYSKIFVDLKTEEFSYYAKNLFMNEQIDLFSKEINNTFLIYIY